MTLSKLTSFLVLFGFFVSYSQEVNIVRTTEKKPLLNIFGAFENQHQFNFSYDVDAIKTVLLDIQKEQLSITTLQEMIGSQTSYLLQKVDETAYILVKNTKIVDICGVVIDAASRFELPQADILLNNQTVSLTNANGVFELQVHPWDSIGISYLGYKNKAIKVSELSKTICDTIKLRPEIQSLGQVLVKEYLTGGIQKNQDASVNISTKKLRILPGLVEPDVLQSLQLLPGINSPTEDPAGLYIRGGTPGQNLVLWDGIKMYHNGHFFNQISTFNPFITKNVTIYRGGTSVRYGDRISGVIVIESDNDLTEKIQAGGGLNLTHGDLYLKLPISEKVGIMLAGRRSTTDLYQNIAYNNLVRKVFQNTRANIPDVNETETAEERSRKDDFSFSDSNFKILWKPNDHNTVKLSAIYAENRLDNTKKIVLDQASNSEASAKDILKIRNIGFSLNWDKKYHNNISQNANFYFSSYDQNYNLYNESVPPADIDFKQNLTINNTVKDIGGEYTLHFPIGRKHAIDFGYQLTYNKAVYGLTNDFLSTSFDSFEERLSINGNGINNTIYTEYKYNTSKAYISMGIRGSYLSNVKQFFIEPRIFSSYKVSNNFTVNTSAELKNQQLNSYPIPIDINPISPLPISENSWLLSNNSFKGDADGDPIPVVKSAQFTFGALYTYKGWNVDLEGYYKKLTNIFFPENNILLNLVLENNSSETIDLYGEEERIGLDLLLKKRIRNYRFWLGYSLSKTLVSFPDIQESYFSGSFDQRHVFNFSQTLKVRNFEFALGWNYATGRPFTKTFRDEEDASGIKIDPRGFYSSKFRDYHRLDASIVYRFHIDSKKLWNGMIGLSVRNIYNRKNILSQSFRNAQDQNFNSFKESFQNESLRITPDLVMRLNF